MSTSLLNLIDNFPNNFLIASKRCYECRNRCITCTNDHIKKSEDNKCNKNSKNTCAKVLKSSDCDNSSD